MCIDVHAHLWTDDYLDLLVRYGKTKAEEHRGLGADATVGDLEARFMMMDAAGVDLQVLSASPQLPTFAVESHAVEAARHVNDLYADIVREHPGRFAAFAAVPLPHVEAALDELGRALDDLGMIGAAVATSTLGRSIADPAWDPLFAELDRRGSVLYVPSSGLRRRVTADQPVQHSLDDRRPSRGHDRGRAPHHQRYSQPVSEHEDHQLPPRRRAADARPAHGQPISLAGARDSGDAEHRRKAHVVGHRQPCTRARAALRM
jgi:predicted TIM-barrel fold metal-dependent hydrolase